MNNIEILQEFIKHYKEVQEKYKDDEIQAEIERSCYFEEVPAQAIENLIQENKELKEKLQQYKKIEEITNKITDDDIKNAIENAEKEYIPKSKVKEKIDQVNKEYLEKLPKVKDLIEQTILGHQRYAMENVLKELLEGE